MESFGSSLLMIGEQMVPILIMSCYTFVFIFRCQTLEVLQWDGSQWLLFCEDH